MTSDDEALAVVLFTARLERARTFESPARGQRGTVASM